jgi:aerobic-type carbon monoxide dehydrogenase small subunit (CoxS/CutS family)
MATTIEFILNGQGRRVTVDARRTLLEVLREDFALTGTKYGCGEGRCRACTVLLDGQPTTSCQTTMEEVAGRKVETIESLANGERLHPVQEAFVQEDAMQCGYCVPGMILTTVALLRRNAQPTREEMVTALNGNLCRCCGYNNLLKAVERCGRPRPAIKEDR